MVIAHSHFRPGGVRRVIELATPHLVAHWPEKIRVVVLASGEPPAAAWLQTFRERLKGTAVRVQVEPAFGYVSELARDGKDLRQRVSDGLLELVARGARDECLIWAHNLGLGRNLYLARELTFTCRCCSIPLVAHHHDWWFENRWHHFAEMREPGFRTLRAMATAVFDSGCSTRHVAINRADAAILAKHYPDQSGWLPNPVEPAPPPSPERQQFARQWLRDRLGESAPVWLMPCRLLRRKNIAEALLLTRWLRSEAWLVTTGGVSSVEEQAYADTLARAAQAHGWRLRLGILAGENSNQPTVAELTAASETVLLTSLQEGFGLPYLETAAAQRPLIARRLPNVAPDLAAFGFEFPQAYRELVVHPALFDWRAERERQRRAFSVWRTAMPRQAAQFVGEPALLEAGPDARPVPFSRLTLGAQLEVLAQPLERSWDLCSALNRFLKPWRDRADSGRLQPSLWPRTANRWLSGPAYARRFLRLLESAPETFPRKDAAQTVQRDFLRKKLRAENLYPLLWNRDL